MKLKTFKEKEIKTISQFLNKYNKIETNERALYRYIEENIEHLEETVKIYKKNDNSIYKTLEIINAEKLYIIITDEV